MRFIPQRLIQGLALSFCFAVFSLFVVTSTIVSCLKGGFCVWLSLTQERPGWQLLEQGTPACLHGHLFWLWHLVQQLQEVVIAKEGGGGRGGADVAGSGCPLTEGGGADVAGRGCPLTEGGGADVAGRGCSLTEGGGADVAGRG